MNKVVEDWMCDLICPEALDDKLERVLDERCISEEEALSLLKDMTGIKYKSLDHVSDDNLRLLINALGGNI